MVLQSWFMCAGLLQLPDHWARTSSASVRERLIEIIGGAPQLLVEYAVELDHRFCTSRLLITMMASARFPTER